MSSDIIDDCVQYLIKGGMAPEDANKFEDHMRNIWGGDDVRRSGYIAKKRRPDSEKVKIAVQEVQSGALSVREAEKKHNVPKSTLHRLCDMGRFKP